jgi:ketosteroid isomerase-like protein
MIDSALMKSARIRLALVAAASVALLGGCGGDDGGEPETARDAAEAYVKARNQGDAGKICQLYTDELIQRLGASNCEAFIKEQTAGVATSYTLVGVRENGDRATATIRAQAADEVGNAAPKLRIELTREGDEWRVSALPGGGD